VISIFVQRLAQGQRPIIYGDGSQTRDFTYVENVVAANLAALRYPRPLAGAVYNVGTGRRVSLLDLVGAINKILGTDIKPEFRPSRPGDVRDSQASLERIREKLNYQAIVDFDLGLRLLMQTESSC
jgi:UDP-glucose 4-epimerase